MKNNLLCALFVSAFFCAQTLTYAQSSKNVEKGLFKLNALSPGASYELGVGRNATFNFNTTLYPYAQEENGGGVDDFVLELYPLVGADFRYFVNMKRRLRKGKDISRNSGNYVALENKMILGAPLLGNIEPDNPFGYTVRVAYGIQRTYGTGFYWGLGFGVGVGAIDDDYFTTSLLSAHLGWVLTKPK